MRQGQQNRRGRGRSSNNGSNNSNNSNNIGRKPQNPLTRNFESSGPDVKIRGTAAQIAEKYGTLARDAASSGDIVMAENYLQHAEHYNRIIMAAQQAQIVNNSQPSASHGHENGHALNNGPQRIVAEPNGAMHEQPQPEINFLPKSPAPVPVKEEKPVEAAAPVAPPAPVYKTPVNQEAEPDPAAADAEKPRRRRRYAANGAGRGKAPAGNGKDMSSGAPDGANGGHSADEVIV